MLAELDYWRVGYQPAYETKTILGIAPDTDRPTFTRLYVLKTDFSETGGPKSFPHSTIHYIEASYDAVRFAIQKAGENGIAILDLSRRNQANIQRQYERNNAITLDPKVSAFRPA